MFYIAVNPRYPISGICIVITDFLNSFIGDNRIPHLPSVRNAFPEIRPID